MNIDVTLIYEDWHGDHSRMFSLGDVPIRAKKLMDATYDSMMAGLDAVRPGATLGDVGAAIQSHAEGQRMAIVRDFCGHGLASFQTPPISCYGMSGEGMELKPGMISLLSRCSTWQAGKNSIRRMDCNRDRSLSAHYEHSVGVTLTGGNFTESPTGLHQPHKTPSQ